MNRQQKKLILIFSLAMSNFGFVPIRASEPRLKLDENHSVVFRWDGSVPKAISEKSNYTTTDITNLDDKSAFKVILDDAGKRWSAVPGVKLNIQAIENDTPSSSADMQHSVSVSKDSDNGMGGVAYPITGDEIPNSNGDEHVIVDCDIEINGGSYTAQILANVVTHEFGHCLGLGHAHTNKKSIMGYSRPGESPELGTDDKAGILYLYPGDNLIKEEKEIIRACGVVDGNSKNHNFPLGVVIIALGIALPILIQRRTNL